MRNIITKTLITAAVATAVATGGIVTAGPAGAIGLPDVAVTKHLLPFGCEAVVTNIGSETARSVKMTQFGFGLETQELGDIAPNETRVVSYIDCAFEMPGIRVVATTANGDSNPFNNFARIYP